jgi:hypothetical protein
MPLLICGSTYYNHSFYVGAIIYFFSSNSLVVRYVLNAMSPQFLHPIPTHSLEAEKTIPTHLQQIIQIMLSAIFLKFITP